MDSSEEVRRVVAMAGNKPQLDAPREENAPKYASRRAARSVLMASSSDARRRGPAMVRSRGARGGGHGLTARIGSAAFYLYSKTQQRRRLFELVMQHSQAALLCSVVFRYKLVYSIV